MTSLPVIMTIRIVAGIGGVAGKTIEIRPPAS